MGLDIIAISRAKYIMHMDESDETIDGYYIANNDYPMRLDGMPEGIYSAEETYHFRAGSYSSYGEWRSELCRLIYNLELEEFCEKFNYYKSPFAELLYHSDCEGSIGFKTSNKLWINFKQYKNIAWNNVTYSADKEWFLKKYEQWTEAFRVAANHGFALFC